MRRYFVGMVGAAFLVAGMQCGAATRDEAEVAPAPPPAAAEVGVASWYGEEFALKPTASGEPFDVHALTAAHRTLDLGTRIRVTNLQNHHTVVLRVNDRGPWIPGRILDVSMEAARRLGFKGQGLTTVRIEVVSSPRTASAQSMTPMKRDRDEAIPQHAMSGRKTEHDATKATSAPGAASLTAERRPARAGAYRLGAGDEAEVASGRR